MNIYEIVGIAAAPKCPATTINNKYNENEVFL